MRIDTVDSYGYYIVKEGLALTQAASPFYVLIVLFCVAGIPSTHGLLGDGRDELWMYRTVIDANVVD
ncbi:hypothetical protein ACFL5Z_17395 [Planctomycetota bacterium]